MPHPAGGSGVPLHHLMGGIRSAHMPSTAPHSSSSAAAATTPSTTTSSRYRDVSPRREAAVAAAAAAAGHTITTTTTTTPSRYRDISPRREAAAAAAAAARHPAATTTLYPTPPPPPHLPCVSIAVAPCTPVLRPVSLHPSAIVGDIFRGSSPRRQAPIRDVLSPGDLSPKRRAYCGGAGGPRRGREGLPGSFHETRAYSPREPGYGAGDAPREKEPRDPTPHNKVIGGAWKGKVPSRTGGAGFKLLHDASGGKPGSAVAKIMRATGKGPPAEAESESKLRADRLEGELAEARREIDALRQGLLHCEYYALPHTINAEFRMEWAPDIPLDKKLPDRNRTNPEVIEDAVDAVKDACKRMHGRMEDALRELCENAEEIHALRKVIEDRDAEIEALKARIAELEKQVAELQEELEGYRLLEPRCRDLQNQVDRLLAQVAELQRLNDKLQLELDQLRQEFARLARRKRAMSKGKDQFLSHYKDPEKGVELKGPAWVPAGGPYKHLLDEEEIRPHKPWVYNKAG